MLRFLPRRLRESITGITETEDTPPTFLVQFYRLARVILAPNVELVDLLHQRTNRPVYLMQRGVDTVMFCPEKRDRADQILTIGYVGRLSPEKSVRVLKRTSSGRCSPRASAEFPLSLSWATAMNGVRLRRKSPQRGILPKRCPSRRRPGESLREHGCVRLPLAYGTRSAIVVLEAMASEVLRPSSPRAGGLSIWLRQAQQVLWHGTRNPLLEGVVNLACDKDLRRGI